MTDMTYGGTVTAATAHGGNRHDRSIGSTIDGALFGATVAYPARSPVAECTTMSSEPTPIPCRIAVIRRKSAIARDSSRDHGDTRFQRTQIASTPTHVLCEGSSVRRNVCFRPMATLLHCPFCPLKQRL
jgi:hypothetical protein